MPTLSEKVWERHVVHRAAGEPDLLYIDLHLVHEVTSPQAFDGLRLNGRRVRRPDLTVATMDHNVPTTGLDRPLEDPISAEQMDVLARNCAEFGIRLYAMGDPGQGIVHVIGPEQGLTQPGHDDRVRRQPHLDARRVRRARVRHRHERGRARARHADAAPDASRERWRSPSTATCPPGVTAKDIVLAIIARIGTGGGIGSVIEYRGTAIRALSMEGRMTVCNMSIEAGARAGLIAPDDTTFAYLEGRPFAPKGAAWEQALDDWRALVTDADAPFDKEVTLDAATLRPARLVGHEPGPDDHDRRRRPVARRVRRPRRARVGEARARLHGPEGRHADPRHHGRHRVHRLVHELAHRGPARRGRRSPAAARCRPACARSSCPARSP